MRIAEGIIFTGLAATLHLAFFALLTHSSTGGGAGDDGKHSTTLTISAQSAQIAYETWQSQPEVLQNIKAFQQNNFRSQNTHNNLNIHNRPTLSPIESPPKQLEIPTPQEPVFVASSQITQDTPNLLQQKPKHPTPEPSSASLDRDYSTTKGKRIDAQSPPRSHLISPKTEDAFTPPSVDPSPEAKKPQIKPKIRPRSLELSTSPVIKQKAKGKTATSNTQIGQSTAKIDKGNNQGDASLKRQWANGIINAIERRKFYPNYARGIGRVTLILTITSKGSLHAVTISKSSGNQHFDKAALSAAKTARYPSAPNELKTSKMRFSITIVMRP